VNEKLCGAKVQHFFHIRKYLTKKKSGLRATPFSVYAALFSAFGVYGLRPV
jgi:hypothetical protein